LILVVAKVGKVKEAKKIRLKEAIYENLLKGADARIDLQIVQVIVCSSGKQYRKNVDVEVFINIDPIIDKTDEKGFFYEGIIKGSVRSEGFVVANIETFVIDEFACKPFYKIKGSLESGHNG
jgi:hypothetical protein